MGHLKIIMLEILALTIYIFVGYFIRKRKLITESGIQDISRIVVNVAMPLLVINSMNIEYNPEYGQLMLQMALASFGFLILGFISSAWICKRISGEQCQRGTLRYCIMFGNAAFLGYPLSYALFQETGMLYASVFVAVQNLFIWTVGINFYKGEKIRLANLKKMINPGIIGITIGLTLLLFNLELPTLLSKVIKGIGNIAVPLALMMIGANLYGNSLKEVITHKRALFITFMKMLILPMIFFIILYFIPIAPIVKSVMMIQAAAPVQASASVYAKNFHGDPQLAARSVFLSTLFCVITIPFFIFLLYL
ncbi:MAG: AEC family transporter [Epulopiscium sp.]|nr:AEC family transporter [Candidatus Epulonipiscium sp.]